MQTKALLPCEVHCPLYEFEASVIAAAQVLLDDVVAQSAALHTAEQSHEQQRP